jgi:hypothetical protein
VETPQLHIYLRMPTPPIVVVPVEYRLRRCRLGDC